MWVLFTDELKLFQCRMTLYELTEKFSITTHHVVNDESLKISFQKSQFSLTEDALDKPTAIWDGSVWWDFLGGARTKYHDPYQVQTQMNIPHPLMSERNARYAGFPAMHWKSGSTFTMRGSSAVSARTSACVWRILSVPELTRVVLNRKTTNWQRNQWCERCADWACKLIKECSRKDRTERQTEWQGAEYFPLCLVEGTEIAFVVYNDAGLLEIQLNGFLIWSVWMRYNQPLWKQHCKKW